MIEIVELRRCPACQHVPSLAPVKRTRFHDHYRFVCPQACTFRSLGIAQRRSPVARAWGLHNAAVQWNEDVEKLAG